ncbi:MAG: TIGR02281 family clan AA aspartic protease [Gammaproteobacteria bacterium]
MKRHPTRTLFVMLGLAALCPSATADRFGNSVVMTEVASGNYYVSGLISNAVKADFLVDTGSGYVTLTTDLFASVIGLPGTEYSREIRGAMANGKIQRVKLYRVKTLTLTEDCVLSDIEVAVIPGSRKNILGLSALRHVAPFALELNPPRLHLSNCVTV